MKELLTEARREILDLRRSNEILHAQMGVVEVFAAALGLKRNGNGAAPDVAWALQKAIDRLSSTKPLSEEQQHGATVKPVAPGPKPIPRNPHDKEYG